MSDNNTSLYAISEGSDVVSTISEGSKGSKVFTDISELLEINNIIKTKHIKTGINLFCFDAKKEFKNYDLDLIKWIFENNDNFQVRYYCHSDNYCGICHNCGYDVRYCNCRYYNDKYYMIDDDGKLISGKILCPVVLVKYNNKIFLETPNISDEFYEYLVNNYEVYTTSTHLYTDESIRKKLKYIFGIKNEKLKFDEINMMLSGDYEIYIEYDEDEHPHFAKYVNRIE